MTKPDSSWDISNLGSANKGFLADFNDPSNRLVFQYNPIEIEESKEINWVELEVPGADDALVQFGSGKSLTLNLQLFFNQMGEVIPTNLLPPVEGVTSATYVEGVLQWLHSFTETRESDNINERYQPSLLLFGFGSGIFGAGGSYVNIGTPALLVRIQSISVKRSFFHRGSLQTRRAVVDITLARHVLYPR